MATKTHSLKTRLKTHETETIGGQETPCATPYIAYFGGIGYLCISGRSRVKHYEKETHHYPIVISDLHCRNHLFYCNGNQQEAPKF